MNKKLVETYMKRAHSIMGHFHPPTDTSIRAQIATFGAALSAGSLLTAIAFFSNIKKEKEENQDDKKKEDKDDKDKAREARLYLLALIYYTITLSDEKAINKLKSDYEEKYKEQLKEYEDKIKNKKESDDSQDEKIKKPVREIIPKVKSPILFNHVIKKIKLDEEDNGSFHESEITNQVYSAAVAIKLALNLFE